MRVTIKPIEGLIDASEIKDIEAEVGDERVIGYSVFDFDGNAVGSEGISETAIAVLSNVLEHTAAIGHELGEAAPRPSVMFSGRHMELAAKPLENTNVLVLKEKGAGMRNGANNAR